MFGVKNESVAAICRGCLSSDRRLLPLVNYDLYFALLDNKETYELQDLKFFNILLCWECTALLQSTAAFRRRLQKAQYALTLAHNKQLAAATLSTLKFSHKQGYDYSIEETIETKPEIDLFTDNCTDLDIKQELDFDHFENDFDYTDNGAQLKEEKVKSKIKKERKQVYTEKRNVKKIDNHIDFGQLDLYFTKVRLSEVEVEESFAKERDDNDCISRPHKCSACGFRFRDRTGLNNHKREYHKKRVISVKCPICGTSHRSRPDLMLHWRRSHSVNRCCYCSRVVERDEDRIKHLYHHSFRYRCLKCDFDFEDKLLYKHHEKELHTRYKCDHCGRTSVSKRSLERHIISSHVPSKCLWCSREFRSRARLARHTRALHAAPGAARAYCVECDVSFATRAKYARHLTQSARHRPQPKLSVPCPECGKIFSRRSYMRNHVKLFHTNDSKHHCTICDKYFVTGFALRSHNKYVHEKLPKPKNKICTVCGRGFGTNRVLENHMRTHTGERPFACARCPAAFAQKVALRAHLAAIHKEK